MSQCLLYTEIICLLISTIDTDKERKKPPWTGVSRVTYVLAGHGVRIGT